MRAWWVVPLVLIASGCLHSSSHPAADHLIQNTGQVGAVKPFEVRPKVEDALGRGETISRRQSDAGGTLLTLERVRYDAANLVITYVAAAGRGPRVFILRTEDPAYQTSDRIGVGASYDQTRKVASCANIRHPDAEGISADCQIGMGFRHPIVVFRVQDGHVVEVVMAASAD